MPRRSQEHLAMRREQVLRFALRCFADQGFPATTMADVIRESGLSAGSVYRYFPSKNALIQPGSEGIFTAARGALAEPVQRPEPASPAQALQHLLDQIMSVAVRDDVDLTRVGVTAWAEALCDPALLAEVSALYRALRGDFVTLLQIWRDAGNLPPTPTSSWLGRPCSARCPGSRCSGCCSTTSSRQLRHRLRRARGRTPRRTRTLREALTPPALTRLIDVSSGVPGGARSLAVVGLGCESGGMVATPRPVIEAVMRSVGGRRVERLVRLTSGGLHETYRVDLREGSPVILRIARQPVPWFTDEGHVMAQAREVGVPTPDVLGVGQVEQDGELLSFSVLQLLPGRSLDELAGELPASDLERLLVGGGELLARVHSVLPDRGLRHALDVPDEDSVARTVLVARQALGPAAAELVERGADFVRAEVMTRPAPRLSLAHGDWLPKHLLIDDGAIVGVIDWEFAGPASPAFDLARWEVSAGDGVQDRSELLRRGYARVADPDAAAAGWLPAFAVDWALEILGWRNPAPPAALRRCVDVIARHAGS